MYHGITLHLFEASVAIHSFELLIGIGLIIAFLGLDAEARHWPKTMADQLFMIATVSLIVGAMGANRITTFLHSNSLLEMADFGSRYSGFSFLPGLVCGGSTCLTLLWWYRLPVAASVNVLIPPLAIAHAFGRIGCFFGGCCFGTPTNLPTAVVFPPASPASTQFGFPVPVHPVQLYEAALLFGIWFITKRLMQTERRIETYLIMYGGGRFALEFLRGDERGAILGMEFLSPSQLICIALMASGVFLMQPLGQVRRQPL